LKKTGDAAGSVTLVRPLGVAFEADHELIDLPIVTELAAE
jgi:hypothetical protein